MKDAIIAQVMLVFQKAIKKFAKKDAIEAEKVSLLLRLNAEKELEIYVSHNHIVVRQVEPKEVMGMTLWLSGLGGMIIEHIKQIIHNFREELKVVDVDICVYLERENDESVDFFLFAKSEYVKQFYLSEVLTI